MRSSWRLKTNLFISFSFNLKIALSLSLRILDTQNALLYILILANEHECPLVTSTAAETTQPNALGLDTGTYTLVSKPARLTFATKVDLVSI